MTRTAPRTRGLLRRVLGRLAYGIFTIFAVIAAILLVRAFDARTLPDLEPWHRLPLAEEFRAGRPEVATFQDYLALEARLFRELDDRFNHDGDPDDDVYLDRFDRTSRSFPGRGGVDWNRSFQMRPAGVPRGGALLLHGLSDSPYSMRALGQRLRDGGYYVLAPRLPGHGTVPAALVEVRWRDWAAIVRLAARHVRDVVGPDGELIVAGYSNGGVLAVDLAVDALPGFHSGTGPPPEMPDRLLLFSPAIGVSGFARFASWHRVLSSIPYFEKFRWLSIEPEFDPFKYNSFTKNSGHQIYELTRYVQARLARAAREGRLEAMPPVLAFQSLVDSTVRTDALVRFLFDLLPDRGHELVLFDVNRLLALEPFMRQRHAALLDRLSSDPGLGYTVTLITNAARSSPEVVERRRLPGAAFEPDRPLGLAWPPQVYSLSHVALPFAPDDPLYGAGSDAPQGPTSPWLGDFRPRGERGVLVVPVEQLMRLRYNPFFDYIGGRFDTDPL